MAKIWKLGVLGLGEGRSILSAAAQSKRWETVQICDLNEELCRQRAQEFGLSGYTLSYEEMLEDPEVEVVGIYTPDQLHAKHIIMALQAGKHVICTKPLMVSLEQAPGTAGGAASRGFGCHDRTKLPVFRRNDAAAPGL